MRPNVAAYRLTAYVTGMLLIVLCVLVVLRVLAVMQIFVHVEAAANVAGIIHGALYIIYLLVAFPLTRRLRLSPRTRGAVLGYRVVNLVDNAVRCRG